VDVLAEFGETWTSLRDSIEVGGGRDLFIHFVVSRKVRLGVHSQKQRLWIHNFFQSRVDSLD